MRYLALTSENRKEMLKAIGINSVDEIYDAVPNHSLLTKPIADLPYHQGEIEVEKFLTRLSQKNLSASKCAFFLGAGCYNHHIPATVDHLIQRSEFLTSYTPYQPEISQGTLTVIFQFQTIISLITGMEVANASMYDGATSLAEGCLMALRIKKDRSKIAIYGNLHPDYQEVVKTYLDLSSIEIINSDIADESCAAIIVQYPDFLGNITKLNKIRKKCDEIGAMMIVCVTEILSLGLIEAPKQADIVVGEAASLGVGLNFGGPSLGFFASKKEFVRQMPGRICGKTTDLNGENGYVLTLNAREQHIRREKATSNICSNQGLCATAFTIHMSLLGENGYKKLALINHHRACELFARLGKIKNIKILNETFFNEFVIEISKDAKIISKNLLAKNIIAGLALENNRLLLSVTELTTIEDIEKLASSLNEILN
jgi:glycine dehydrogenase subunit 1